MKNNDEKNIFWQKYSVTRIQRQKKYGHKSIVIWFTGLSGSGKSTIANFLETILFKNNIHTCLLDGDNIRLGLSANLTFTTVDREENIRRIAEVAKLILNTGIIVLVSVISPYIYQRNMISNILGKKNVLEVFVDTPINICQARDPKHLYKKVRRGEISNFTGIQSIYERPKTPDLLLDGTESLETNANNLIKILYLRDIIPFSEY